MEGVQGNKHVVQALSMWGMSRGVQALSLWGMWMGVQGRGFLLTNCLTFGNYWVAPKPSVFALYCVYCFTSSWLLISVLLHFCFCLLYTHSFTVLQFCSFTVYCLCFLFQCLLFTHWAAPCLPTSVQICFAQFTFLLV